MPYDIIAEPPANGIHHPAIPHAPPPEALPSINVYRLTGADLRAFLSQRDADEATRQEIGFDLLEKAVDGGMAAIPLPYIGQYIEQLNALLSEAVNPRGADGKNSPGGSRGTSTRTARSRRS